MTAQLGFVPKGNGGPGAKNVFSAGLKYASGPLSAAVSMQTKEDNTTKNFVSAAGSYDFGVAKVMLGYADGGKVADGGTGAGVSTGFVAPIGSVNVGLLYGQNTDDDVKARSVELFANTEIFKNTYAYAEVGRWNTSLNVPKKNYTGYAVGVIFTF